MYVHACKTHTFMYIPHISTHMCSIVSIIACLWSREVPASSPLVLCAVPLSQESMKCNEDKVQFYTGLPNYATLILIIQFVTNGLPLKGKLSHFQQILLVHVNEAEVKSRRTGSSI